MGVRVVGVNGCVCGANTGFLGAYDGAVQPSLVYCVLYLLDH